MYSIYIVGIGGKQRFSFLFFFFPEMHLQSEQQAATFPLRRSSEAPTTGLVLQEFALLCHLHIPTKQMESRSMMETKKQQNKRKTKNTET